jgi:2-polyprenyl-6-methoxyphenol hydroxylase-like FAD-dependent oxidoreductase
MGAHAVVLGGSISGLLAARVLSEFYDQVTIVERDALPDGADPRRGVPQGRHFHALLASGARVLDDLFPGILDELADAGATVLSSDKLSDLWQELGGYNLHRESGEYTRLVRAYQMTRPFLEAHIRRRLRAISTVSILDEHDVSELIATATRVTGARICPHSGGAARELRADLVVDATGRGGRTPAFLDSLGYGRPAESGLTVHVTYSSQMLRVRPPAPPSKLFIVGTAPGRSVGGALAACEDDTWILTAAGMAGNEPPTEWEALRDFTATWAPEPMTAALHRAEPIGVAARYRYPSSQWRRYDRMRNFPDGLLVFGDAICSFNPVYGQGMSVVALEAAALRQCLADGDTQLSRRFFTASARPISMAWQMATGADLSIPEVDAKRTLATRAMAWYTDRVLAACASDLRVMEQFSRVANLLDPPSALMSPAVARRVLGRRRSASAAAVPQRSAAVP